MKCVKIYYFYRPAFGQFSTGQSLGHYTLGKSIIITYFTIIEKFEVEHIHVKMSPLVLWSATAMQTYNIAKGIQPVITVLRAHRVCVLWKSS